MIALAMTVLLGGATLAADREGNFWVFTFQGNSCGSWLAENRKDGFGLQLMETWVLGYLTAYNDIGYDGYNVAEGTDIGGLYTWIDGYCREHPRDSLLDATHDLILELERRQGTK